MKQPYSLQWIYTGKPGELRTHMGRAVFQWARTRSGERARVVGVLLWY